MEQSAVKKVKFSFDSPYSPKTIVLKEKRRINSTQYMSQDLYTYIEKSITYMGLDSKKCNYKNETVVKYFELLYRNAYIKFYKAKKVNVNKQVFEKLLYYLRNFWDENYKSFQFENEEILYEQVEKFIFDKTKMLKDTYLAYIIAWYFYEISSEIFLDKKDIFINKQQELQNDYCKSSDDIRNYILVNDNYIKVYNKNFYFWSSYYKAKRIFTKSENLRRYCIWYPENKDLIITMGCKCPKLFNSAYISWNEKVFLWQAMQLSQDNSFEFDYSMFIDRPFINYLKLCTKPQQLVYIYELYKFTPWVISDYNFYSKFKREDIEILSLLLDKVKPEFKHKALKEIYEFVIGGKSLWQSQFVLKDRFVAAEYLSKAHADENYNHVEFINSFDLKLQAYSKWILSVNNKDGNAIFVSDFFERFIKKIRDDVINCEDKTSFVDVIRQSYDIAFNEFKEICVRQKIDMNVLAKKFSLENILLGMESTPYRFLEGMIKFNLENKNVRFFKLNSIAEFKIDDVANEQLRICLSMILEFNEKDKFELTCQKELLEKTIIDVQDNYLKIKEFTGLNESDKKAQDLFLRYLQASYDYLINNHKKYINMNYSTRSDENVRANVIKNVELMLNQMLKSNFERNKLLSLLKNLDDSNIELIRNSFVNAKGQNDRKLLMIKLYVCLFSFSLSVQREIACDVSNEILCKNERELINSEKIINGNYGECCLTSSQFRNAFGICDTNRDFNKLWKSENLNSFCKTRLKKAINEEEIKRICVLSHARDFVYDYIGIDDEKNKFVKLTLKNIDNPNIVYLLCNNDENTKFVFESLKNGILNVNDLSKITFHDLNVYHQKIKYLEQKIGNHDLIDMCRKIFCEELKKQKMYGSPFCEKCKHIKIEKEINNETDLFFSLLSSHSDFMANSIILNYFDANPQFLNEVMEKLIDYLGSDVNAENYLKRSLRLTPNNKIYVKFVEVAKEKFKPVRQESISKQQDIG